MTEPRLRPAVTIVCWNAYPLFNPTVPSRIGGMETRAALFARGLAASGTWRVNFVVNDFGQPDVVNHDGIAFHLYQPWHLRASQNVNPRFARRKWFPVLNLDRRDWSLLWQMPLLGIYRLLPAWAYPHFWRRQHTEVVCCFGNNAISAQVIADCSRLRIKTVLCIAADSDLAPDYLPDNQTLNDYSTPKWMGHYALENADHIFVQTESQRQALAQHFGRLGEIIRNPVDIAEDAPANWPPRDSRDTILWIGRSDTFHKQPLLLLELARRCPDLPFLMIMNKTYADVFDAILAQRPPNLTIVERVPHRDIWNYYRRARVFVSTSAYEGFPNTFLQCAVAGVPVTSLAVDPEHILSRHGCGLLADGDIDALEGHVRTLWLDADLAERHARAFHHYAHQQHGLAGQVERFEALLRQVIDSPLRDPERPWWHQPRRRFVRRTEP